MSNGRNGVIDTTIVAAETATRLGLVSNSVDAARITRSKYLSRLALRREGLPVPKFRRVSIAADPEAEAKRAPYPCVLKPVAQSASRGVIREAVTLVESHMLAETRRGVGGGLVVAEPGPNVVEGIVSLYLARKKATEVELLEARLPLEILAMRSALERLDARGVDLLEAERAHELGAEEDLTHASHRFHNLLAELSGNTVLQLFVLPGLADARREYQSGGHFRGRRSAL